MQQPGRAGASVLYARDQRRGAARTISAKAKDAMAQLADKFAGTGYAPRAAR